MKFTGLMIWVLNFARLEKSAKTIQTRSILVALETNSSYTKTTLASQTQSVSLSLFLKELSTYDWSKFEKFLFENLFEKSSVSKLVFTLSLMPFSFTVNLICCCFLEKIKNVKNRKIKGSQSLGFSMKTVFCEKSEIM